MRPSSRASALRGLRRTCQQQGRSETKRNDGPHVVACCTAPTHHMINRGAFSTACGRIIPHGISHFQSTSAPPASLPLTSHQAGPSTRPPCLPPPPPLHPLPCHSPPSRWVHEQVPPVQHVGHLLALGVGLGMAGDDTVGDADIAQLALIDVGEGLKEGSMVGDGEARHNGWKCTDRVFCIRA